MTGTYAAEHSPDALAGAALSPARRSQMWGRLRFLGSWILALILVAVALPRTVDVSWHGLLPALRAVHWPALLALVALWLLGLFVHSFVLTAAAPALTHRRALTLNVTGSAVANVVPLGGAAGVELNRRMMKAWGIDTRAFAGYTFLTNLWDVASKLLLPMIGVIALVHAGETITPQLKTASVLAGIAFLGLAAFATVLLLSPRGTAQLGHGIEQTLRFGLRLIGRDRALDLAGRLNDVRSECAGLVASGWVRMTAGITGYVALQWLLLGFCLQLTGAGTTWPEVLAGFAVERLFTIVPLTPGGVGVADLGLVGVLLTLGGDPAGVTAAAVLYRLFVFAVEIPVGGGVLGIWFLAQRRTPARPQDAVRSLGPTRRIAHVTDVFLPRLGGIETHVDDLVRHQRATGLDAHVLTPTPGNGPDPAWVRRMPAVVARGTVTEYDTIHVHISMWSPYGIAVARAAMAAGMPTLITVHSMWAGAGGLLRLIALAGLRRWPVAWSAVSGAAAEAFRRSLNGAEVAVLPNAIDIDSWRPRPAPIARREPQAAEGPLTVVSVMRLMPRKRPLQLLDMFERIRALTPNDDVRLVIVGDGPLHRRLQRAVRRRGLDERVRITGRIPRHQVLEELQAASLYVAPAPKESFGIAALEARCAGLPVVAHRRSGVGEFVRDRVDGILVANDTEMVVAIADLVRDPSLRNRFTAHNRRVAPKLDWSDILRQTDALYLKAASRAVLLTQEIAAPVPVMAEA
ncbi:MULTISPECIES: glycosyltransferase [unclassified Nocardioides]|uniref:glycosyltransferase n=1 Tax=unclassified Nocardioides TaxID=2615069 RepID=UPI0000EB6156|nr:MULTISPECIES: glycosyltransferase [unclassified Nocardioides]ABL81077.1 glycosyl transferase, group 1 [Nocardioides sp. JS614]